MKRSLWQSEDGTALMECALVMPLLVFLIFMLIQLSLPRYLSHRTILPSLVPPSVKCFGRPAALSCRKTGFWLQASLSVI